MELMMSNSGGGGYELFNRVNQLVKENVTTVTDLKKVPASLSELRKVLDQILADPGCCLLYTTCDVARATVLNSLVKLLKSVYNDQIKKSSVVLMKRFADLDYDERANCFMSKSAVRAYGAMFSSIHDIINDHALDESFYAEEAKPIIERSRDSTLTILLYYFKSIHLKQLHSLGFRHRFYQFLVVNFVNSRRILGLIEAVTSNLIESPELLYNETGDELDSDQFYLNMVDSVYLISLKSCHLLVKAHLNAPNGLKKILRIQENVGIYLSQVKPHTGLPKINMRVWRTLSRKIVKMYGRKLGNEAKTLSAHSRLMFDFQFMLYYLRIVHIHYNNILKLHAKMETDNLFRSVKMILVALGERINEKELEPEAQCVRNECFKLISLFCKKIGKLFVKANLDEFLAIWEIHLLDCCPAACQALESVMKIKLKKTTRLARQLLDRFVRQLTWEDHKRKLIVIGNCAASLFKFYCVNYPNALRFDQDLIAFINSIKFIMKSLTLLDCKYLEAHLSFNHQLLQALSQPKLKSKPWRLLYEDILIVFSYLLHGEYEYDVPSKVYYQCLPVIKLMSEQFHKEPNRFSDYMFILDDMINRIKFELRNDFGNSNKLSLLASVDTALARSIQI